MQQVKQEQADLDEDRDDNEDDEDDEDDDEDPIATLTISQATKKDGTFGDNGFGLTDVSVQDQKQTESRTFLMELYGEQKFNLVYWVVSGYVIYLS